MATITFYPSKPTGESTIYIRLSLKRGKDFRLSTGFSVKNVADWNPITKLPKKNNEYNKLLHSKLYELESFITSEIDKLLFDNTKSIDDVSSKWVKNIISQFNNEAIEDDDFLIVYANKFLRNLHTKTYIKNGQNFKYKKDTIDKYKYFVDDLIAFEINLGKKIKVIDVDDHLNNEFISFLRDFEGQFPNTIGRTVKRLKTLIKDAEMNGKRVNIRYRLIRGFEDETIITFLTLDEINKIINTQMPNSRLGLAKEWMIIGCFTAQRISDLYRLESSMIVYENNIPFIYLKQYKTEKKVKIPVHYKVEEILKKYNLSFPPNFSSNEKSNRTMLSGLIKEVCKISDINDVVRGRLNGAIGNYPKYQLISNHTLRRSFASNFYGMEGWNTPMVMEITGHSTEKNFYKYVDKDNFTLSEKAALNFAKMKREDM